MAYNFRRKKKSQKTSEDLNLDKEIEQLECSIAALISQQIPVPESMAVSLANMKAKRNPNKINAKKFIYNGIEYDSVREARFAEALDKSGLKYEYQIEISLQPAFKLDKESIQDICIIVDFMVDGQFFVDVKGFIMPVFSLKWKMLKFVYQDTREYFIIKKDSDIQGFIAFAKSREWKGDLLSL